MDVYPCHDDADLCVLWHDLERMHKYDDMDVYSLLFAAARVRIHLHI